MATRLLIVEESAVSISI